MRNTSALGQLLRILLVALFLGVRVSACHWERLDTHLWYLKKRHMVDTSQN